MSGCTLAWQVFPNNKGGIPVCIVDIFRRKYSICHGTKWDLVELAIVKTHSRFCLRYGTNHNWHFYGYNLQSYVSVHSSRHPSSLPFFLLQLPILSVTHSPYSLIHPVATQWPTHPPNFPTHLPTHSLTDLPTTSTHSVSHSLTHFFTHSLTHSFTHSLSDSLNHSLTDYNEGDIHEIFQSGVLW